MAPWTPSVTLIPFAHLLLLASLAPAQSELYSFASDPQFGPPRFDVDTIGDVNADGVPDWIASYERGARVHSGVDGSVIHSFPSAPVDPSFGWGVAGTGDLDADGVPDFLVAAHRQDGQADQSGVVHLFSGATGLTLYTIEGTHLRGSLGLSSARMGDLDGDGVDDLALGVPGAFGSVRRVQVHSGRTGSLLYTVIDLTTHAFGRVVRNAGDVDGDGSDDIAIQGENGASGFLRIVSGAVAATAHPTLLEISDEDFADPHEHIGFAIDFASAGDVNGDGTPDIVIGAAWELVTAGHPGANSVTGRVRMFDGATGDVIWTQAGETTGFGFRLDVVGDLDGDGISDVLAAGTADQRGFNPGGPPQQPRYGAATALSGASGRRIYQYQGEFDYDGFGSRVVAGVGDVNGDGLSDFAISSRYSRDPGYPEGRTRVISGAGCPQPRRYCTSLPHSQSFPLNGGASINFTGSASAGSNDLILWVELAPRNRVGALLVGSVPMHRPMGEGILCIGGLTRTLAPVTLNLNGFAYIEVADLTMQPFAVGQTAFVQFAFRDPGASSTPAVNFSDALAVMLCP